MNVIKKVLKRLGEVFDRLVESLLGERRPEPQLIPIPVRDRSSRSNNHYRR